MTDEGSLPALRVPEREVPVPPTVSPEARAMLALGMVGPEPEWLGVELDAEGWKKLVAEREAAVIAMTGAGGEFVGATVEEEDLGGFVVYKIRPDGVPADDRRVFLDFHGGGFIQDGGQIACSRAVDFAKGLGATVWSVDYRMPPDHPFPTTVDDCVAGYRRLLDERRPEEVVIGGSSAGGNLAAACVLKGRDEGLPLPAAAVLNTPCTDLTESSDSWWTNEGVDTVLRGVFAPAFELYAGGHDLKIPYISVVYADLTQGFPPTILTTGTRDKLLSDTVRFHRALLRAGVEAELHVWEAMGHAGFLGMSPEDNERAAQIRLFCENHWASAVA
ncbi:alpha/beta hydrolase [Pseudofrankia inefficax]|uniref:Esterase/lipase/thioesterase family protein n=1 Tax=Pseudofrankia inefficax (strain DSM 45817 / CECT 9037 / DDB 130130 / EuI1c) TaxID=298654 RepID=E3J831_PSEI1|nr:alpha/beta hydrolase [Pseudofrankia inefficax]ADP82079.1 esterase/lipase/thioesterase family protein [Pseudofrankia inefficax]